MVEFNDIFTPVDCVITEETSLKKAIKILKQKKWDLLPVMDSSRSLKGVFTRSGLYQMILDGHSLNTPIRKYIKQEARTIRHYTPYSQIEQIVKTSHVGTGVVLDEHDKVIGLLTKTEMVMSLLNSANNLKEQLETIVAAETTLEYAYDGILMTNDQMKITMVSPPLLELFNLEKSAVLHQDVQKILPQLNMAAVFKSQSAEISDFDEINGIKYIVHRIPIKKDGSMIGAIGKVMFRQLNEVSELFNRPKKNDLSPKKESAKFTWEHIFSVDPYLDKLKKSAARAAKGVSTVLIRGESGTGKELFAHAIHNSSSRKQGKFVVVNCAAIPEELLESEFFGYEEGAFTGAKQRGKSGKFDLANGGTLFLDEIGDMSLALQAKLLRVLQEREFYRVGGNETVKVDVRIIAATNRDLEKMVREGKFREDLYYRLNVISLTIPPLRERVRDVEHLIRQLMKELNALLGTGITGISAEAKMALQQYEWPGNVRELRNVLERAMTFAENGKIEREDLPDYLRSHLTKPSGLAFDAELGAIKKALNQTNGNKAQAARILGISRSGLYEKIKKYQLSDVAETVQN